MNAPANWYPDPMRPGAVRYWDGLQWTEHVAVARSAAAAGAPQTPPAAMSKGAKAGLTGGAIAFLIIGIVIVVGLVVTFVPFLVALFNVIINLPGIMCGETQSCG